MEQRLEYGFIGLKEALKRVATYEHDEKFAPLAETIVWIELLNSAFWDDDIENQRTVYRERRAIDPGGKLIEALRYARHRLVHDIKVYGLHGAMNYGGSFSGAYDTGFDIGHPTWVWRDISPLSEAKNAEGEEDYKEFLQGREVEPTLRAASKFLREYHRDWLTGAHLVQLLGDM